MTEADRIQQIIEREGATEPEARFLHHLGLAWQEATSIWKEDGGRPNLPEITQFGINYRDLQQIAFSRIHRREHPIEE